jgi:hypothetical protein
MSYYDDYNEKHNFTFRFDSNDGEVHLEMNCNELYLNDILARFKEFMQGCGYAIHGEIGVVEYDSEPEQVKQEPKFDFSNIPNNNWPFGSLKTESIPTLTTADLAQIKPIDLSSLTVTDLSTMTTQSYSDWSGINKYPTMAPLTSEQIQSWSTEMPGTLGSAKVKF